MIQAINIRDLINLFVSKKKMITVFVVFFTLLLGSISFFISPYYEVRTDILVNYSNSQKSSSFSSLQVNEIDMNLRLIETYKQMLKSDRMISKVNEELEKPYSKGTILKNIQIETSNNSQIISLIVQEETGEAAATLANVYAQVFQQQVKELMNLDNINILKNVSAETDVIMNKPNPVMYYSAAFFISVLICVVTILLREFYRTVLNTRIKTEKALGISNLGVISHFKQSKRKKSNNRVKLIQNLNNPIHITEEFRSLRANVLFQMEQKKVKAIMVTSSDVEDGRTFISGNLATVMAMDGKRTVYIDADLRKPDGRKLFDLPNRQGLTSIVTENFKLSDVIQQTSIKNLSFLGSGPIPMNPAEILSTPIMKQIIEELKLTFDVIIFDTPPLIVTDAISLSSSVDGCLFVVDASNTKAEVARKSIGSLTSIGTTFLGSVLNRSKNEGIVIQYEY